MNNRARFYGALAALFAVWVGQPTAQAQSLFPELDYCLASSSVFHRIAPEFEISVPDDMDYRSGVGMGMGLAIILMNDPDVLECAQRHTTALFKFILTSTDPSIYGLMFPTTLGDLGIK
ncbi:MAG: hypothetical protein KDD44_05135 [Bdellovibrionales bacterium]|nr:hypothetical protein [Bdellovibrionales bacterium]